MKLKRLYDHDAPSEKWVEQVSTCPNCQGDGVVINATLDGVEPCPNCEQGTISRTIPPVCGVVVNRAGPRQKFSPSLVMQGLGESWLQLTQTQIIITGVNEKLVYKIKRAPGSHQTPNGLEVIHYYDCQLVERQEVA